MNNIEKFKKIHYFSENKELTNEEVHQLGICIDPVNGDYQSLEERAYQAAYDISNDWVKETPEWKDVEDGFKRGVKEALEYVKELVDSMWCSKNVGPLFELGFNEAKDSLANVINKNLN